MRINTNVASMIAWRSLSSSDNAVTKSLERLSSGLRINRAADDVAGLAISEGIRTQVRGLNQAVKNAQDGASLIQTAEASLNETHTMLQRMRELALQAANGTLQPEDRVALQTEMDHLATEITRATGNTQFNKLDLLDGSLTAGGTGNLTLQVGANSGASQVITLGIQAMDAKSLGIARDVLTGVVDNGLAVEASASGTIAREILDVGEGFVPGKYRLAFSTPPDAVRLLTEYGVQVGQTVTIDPADKGIVTVGDLVTNQTLTIQLSAVPPTNGEMDLIAVRPREEAVATVGKVGAGIQAGHYQVSYDPSFGTIQLLDSSGKAVGTTQQAVAGATILLGDRQSGRTVEVTLKESLPAGALTDHIWLGTPVARVKGNPPPPSDILAPIHGSGNAGAGLANGIYRVRYDAAAGTVQLQDSTGTVNIGAAQTFVPGNTLTLGDPGTFRTLDVTLADVRPAGTGYATVNVGATYVVDNGGPTFPAGSSALWDRIIAVGPNMQNGNYTLSYDQATQTVRLTSPSGMMSAPVAFNPDQMEMTVSLGGGESVRFVLPAPPPTANTTATFNVTGAHELFDTAVVGTGFTTEPPLRVDFDPVDPLDPTDDVVLLYDNAGNLLDAATATPGANVTLGSGTATVAFTVPNPPPASATSDRIVLVDSRVMGNPAPTSNAILPASGAGAIDNVGPNLDSGLYRVAYDASTGLFQLQDLNGHGIGEARAAGPGNKVTLGDAETGRSLSVTVNSPIYASGFATVEVTNNQGAAEAALFQGGEKVSAARAGAGLNISSVEGAQAAVTELDAAIERVSHQRAQLGAAQNQLEHTMANLGVISENLTGAESRIRDVDMALEMTTLVKHQILLQSTSAMMAQANQKQQLVLSLLKQ